VAALSLEVRERKGEGISPPNLKTKLRWTRASASRLDRLQRNCPASQVSACIPVRLFTPKRASAAKKIGARRAENRVSGSGAVSGVMSAKRIFRRTAHMLGRGSHWSS